jgi:hypothetical protein
MNLKYLSILFGLITLTFLFIQAEDHKVEMGTVTGSRVNIRARPLGTAEVCCQLVQGDLVEILERKQIQVGGSTNSEEWVKIVLPEKATVWVQSGFIENDAITKKVNGRAGPGLNWPILCTFSKGDHVQVKTNHLEWTGVTPPRNASAWISGLYVKSGAEEIPTARTKEGSEEK